MTTIGKILELIGIIMGSLAVVGVVTAALTVLFLANLWIGLLATTMVSGLLLVGIGRYLQEY